MAHPIANKAHVSANAMRSWRKRNSEHYKKYITEYQQENWDKYKEASRRYQARRRAIVNNTRIPTWAVLKRPCYENEVQKVYVAPGSFLSHEKVVQFCREFLEAAGWKRLNGAKRYLSEKRYSELRKIGVQSVRSDGVFRKLIQDVQCDIALEAKGKSLQDYFYRRRDIERGLGQCISYASLGLVPIYVVDSLALEEILGYHKLLPFMIVKSYLEFNLDNEEVIEKKLMLHRLLNSSQVGNG